MKRKAVNILLFGILLTVGALCGPQRLLYAAKPDKPNEVRIYGAEYRKRSGLDNGSVRIFLKNCTLKPLTISKCRIEKVISDPPEKKSSFGDTVPFIYARVFPPFVKPGEVGELLIKLGQSVGFVKSLRCSFTSSEGSKYSITLPQKQSPIMVTSVGFPHETNEVYVYVQNSSEESIKISGIEINESEIEKINSSINNPIPPKQKACFVIDLKRRFRVGEYLYIVLSAKDNADKDIKLHAVARATRNFPIAFHSGSHISKYNLDPFRAFVQSFKHTTPSVPAAILMSCASHAHGTIEEASRKFIDAHNDLYLEDPNALSGLWICISGDPQYLYTFGGLSDFLLVKSGPFAHRNSSDFSSGNEALDSCYVRAAQAHDAVLPNRFYAWIQWSHDRWSDDRFKTRFVAYAALAAGAKGIVYRDYEKNPEMMKSISKMADFSRLNMELQLLKPLIAASEPVDWVNENSPTAIAKTLLYGTKKLLLILFDRNHLKNYSDSIKTSTAEALEKKNDIIVNIPRGFSVEKVQLISRPNTDVRWQFKDKSLKIHADLELSSEVLVISLIPE